MVLKSFQFSSDNASGAHPLVLQDLSTISHENQEAYGNDKLTAKVKDIFKEYFGSHSEVFFTFNGTASNVISLRSMCRSFETIYCSSCAHIYIDEAGAAENFIGSKIIPIESDNGKILLEPIRTHVKENQGIVHRSQPKVISITQASERGTLYSLDEIHEIISFAHKNGLLVHIDGARLANAAVALNKSFKELTTDLGIDILSFGGTKNGLMFAEAIVVLNSSLLKDLPYIHKQAMQLCSKNRFLSSQFLTYFTDELWKENAKNANSMAQYFAKRLSDIPEVVINSPVEVNMLFASIPRAWIKPLQEYFSFYVWSQEESEIRLVTSFNTKKAQIDEFIAKMQWVKRNEPPKPIGRGDLESSDCKSH